MEPEERELLEKTYRLVYQNHKLLKKMNRRAMWESVLRILYWIVIIGAAAGAYYFVAPYLEVLIDTYNRLTEGVQGISNSLDPLQNIFSR